jgi:predicted enzyme related to lactoylglutathione lyase
MTNKIWHVELATTDKEATVKFYKDMFGWHVQTFELMDYTMTAFPEGDTTMAFVPVNEEQNTMPGSVLVYVDVDDVDATIARAKELGAMVIMDKMEIEGTGWMAVFGDPGGNRIAVMQRMEPPAA